MAELIEMTELKTTVEQLRLVNEELQRKKVDAEKDRDLFRDLYSKASAHASEVTKENNELHERAVLAEGQVRDGLSMIKGTYEERVRRLEMEMAKWKQMCEVLTARDTRTNDEVRRRAALQPDLTEENARLKEELEKLKQDYHNIEVVLEQVAEKEQSSALPLIAPQVEAVNVTSVTSLKVVP